MTFEHDRLRMIGFMEDVRDGFYNDKIKKMFKECENKENKERKKRECHNLSKH